MDFCLSNAGRHQQGNQRKIQIPAEILSSWFILPGQRGGCVQKGLLWSHIGRPFRQNYFAQGMRFGVGLYMALQLRIMSHGCGRYIVESLMAYTMFQFTMTTVTCMKRSTGREIFSFMGYNAWHCVPNYFVLTPSTIIWTLLPGL